jgi:hypothetical protein
MMIGRIVTRFASRLRYPMLFKLVAGLFLLDLLVPDIIPFADEILLALGTLLLGAWKRRGDPDLPQAGYSSAR